MARPGVARPDVALGTIKGDLMDSKGFVNLPEETQKIFAQDAIEEVNKDFNELFLSMFSEARRIAVEESGANVKFQIDRVSWQRGKWFVLKKGKSNRYGTTLSILRFINILIPIAIGYGLADVKTQYWIVIIGIAVFAATYILQDRIEANR